MLLATVLAILVLDAVLVVVTWLLITVAWNTIAREELEVRSNLTWVCLLGIVVAIANAVAIAHLVRGWGEPTFLSFVLTLLLDASLMFATWCLIDGIWNTVVKERFRVRGYLAWAYLMSIVVLIANAVAIAILL